MIAYISGIVPWIQSRTLLLLNQLKTSVYSKSTEKIKEANILLIEEINKQISELIDDKTYLIEDYADQHLTNIRVWVRSLSDIESVILPTIERWGDEEEKAQKILSRICKEGNLPPAVSPIIALYSADYFQVYDLIIYIPRLESHFLLHLPDLYHEVAHILIDNFDDMLIDPIRDIAQEYFDKQSTQHKLLNSPIAEDEIFDNLQDAWQSEWLVEFACDAIATYMCGPAYGWAHFHLCAMKSDDYYSPSIDEPTGTHPSDYARMNLILSILTNLNFVEDGNLIRNHWNNLIQLANEQKPAYTDLVYPNDLIIALQKQLQEGLEHLGVITYSTKKDSTLAYKLNMVWKKFWENPAKYREWEEVQQL